MSVNARNNDSFASATSSGAVTASDSTVLDFNALYVSGTGDVAVKHVENGLVTTYVAVPSGSILPVAGVRVMAATTATSIVWMKW
jgi:hypothetical protein